MCRFFLDTNIVIDLLSPSRPAHSDAAALVRRALDSGDDRIIVLSSSLKDAYYVLCRHYSDERKARESIRCLVVFADIAELTATVVNRALADSEPDFEDGLIREAALMSSCDALVTRDRLGFKNMPVPVVDSEDAVNLLR